MKFNIVITIISYWIVYASVSGVIEAYIWTLNARNPVSKKQNGDIHSYFLIQRFVVWVLAFGLFLALTKDKYSTIAFAIALFLSFPFFHLGAMYHMRNKLDGSYPHGFSSDPSPTSQAKINISFSSRFLLLVGAVILFSAILILKV